MKKSYKIVLITLCTLILLVGLILLGAHLLTPVIYGDFFESAVAEYEAAGLSDGLVQQGFAYLENEKVYLQCGYMNDGSASRIYILPEGDEANARYVSMLAADGTPYTGHPGGLTSYGNFVWISNDGNGEDNCVWVLSLDELLAQPNGGTVTLSTRFYPQTRAAYCLADGEYLWVGEFYREQDYPTDPAHTFTVAGGTEHHALVCAYRLDSNAEYGIADLTPVLALSVAGQVQGFAMTEQGGFILSSSFGLSSSILRFYPSLASDTPDASITMRGEEIPVYFLDEQNIERLVKAPPMSEEIIVKDGRLYVLFESACKKYIFGNFTRGRDVYSIPLE